MKKNDIIDGTTYLVTPNGTSKYGGRAVIKAIARLPVYRRASSALYGNQSVLAVELCADYKGPTYVNQDAAHGAYHGTADLKVGDRMVVRTADIVRPWTDGDDAAVAEQEREVEEDARLEQRVLALTPHQAKFAFSGDNVIIDRKLFETILRYAETHYQRDHLA